MSHALYVYDFTASADSNKHEQIIKKLTQECKWWIFQEELSESGYQHYQGRFSLKEKIRITTLIKKFKVNWHFSITNNSTIQSDIEDYVTKEETRVNGPWRSDTQPEYIPKQIQPMVGNLRPFQQRIVESSKIFDPRTINVIFDTKGNNGKSMLSMYVRCFKIGRKIVYENDYKSVMRAVCDQPVSTLYLVDIPRAIRKEQMYNFWASLEEIKNGYAFDDRYHFKEKIFDSPAIWVFMNQLPEESLLSRDRWRIWTINEQFELEPWRKRTLELIDDDEL